MAELELSTLDADVDDVDDVDGRCVARKLNLVSSFSFFLRSRHFPLNFVLCRPIAQLFISSDLCFVSLSSVRVVVVAYW